MALLLAGTAFNQVISLEGKQKQVFGDMRRQAVTHLVHDPLQPHRILYASPNSISQIAQGQTSEILRTTGKQTVVHLEAPHTQRFIYALSDGTIGEWVQGKKEPALICQGQGQTGYKGATGSADGTKMLLFGEGIVPVAFDLTRGIPLWKGRNVQNDELDLQVPINDLDGVFLNEQIAALLHFRNEMRFYDIRSNKRRPVSIHAVGAAPRSRMQRMCLGAEDRLYLGSDIGQVVELDGSRNWQSTGKFKGITTSITGLSAGEGQLVTSSLDCYVRIFDLSDRSLQQKHYFNKPITALSVLHLPPHIEEEGEHEENLEEEQGQSQAKIKMIRKRNKVGLKYLRAREFDSEQQIIKEQEGAGRANWYHQLNPLDRREFEE